MKKISYLILLLAFSLFAATEGTVISPRYADGNVHLGLPSWVDMSDAESASLSWRVPGTTDNTTLITLDNEHAVTYAGKTYSALSVYPDGRIALGNVNVNLDDGLVPYVKPVNTSMVNLSRSFKWKLFSEDFGDHVDHYTAIQLGPFSYQGYSTLPYSCQILFYSDGEIQVQLWSNGASSWITAKPAVNQRTLPEWSEWMAPSFYDGRQTRVISDMNAAKSGIQMLYGADGLRPGWVAKSFKSDAVSINENTGSSRNLAVDFGRIKDAGGLLAYDNSREHPVVGSFYGLEIATKTETEITAPIYFWYFTEIDGTYYNRYPSITDKVSGSFWVSGLDAYLDQINLFRSSTGNSLLYTLFPVDYAYSWDKLGSWDFSGNDDLIEFRPAPAVKFQVIESPSSDTKFSIYSIMYYLKQQSSVQFLPPKPPYTLKFTSNEGGSARVEDFSGSSPYSIYDGQQVSARIVANPGQEIECIKINGVTVFSDGKFNSTEDTSNPLYIYAQMLVPQVQDFYEYIDFKAFVHQNLEVNITFSECEGRKLPVVTPAMVKTETFLDPPSVSSVRRMASLAIRDGFGDIIQTQDSIANGKYLISAVYKDDLLKTKYTPISFVRDATAFDYLDMACYNCITRSNAYHDGSDLVDRQNALGQAYTEVNARYGNNSGSLGTAAGVGDASFNLFSEQAESWVLPALSENDFIPADLLNIESIATSYQYRTNAVNSGVVYDYTLEISKNTEGHYTQSISNAMGLVLSSWIYDGSKEIIHKNQYDYLNRLIKSYPKDHSELSTDYVYDAQGRVISTVGPDRGLSETKYDSLGRVRFVRTARQKAKGNDYFSAKVYDDLGREICTGEVTGGHSFESPDVEISESSLSLRSKVIYGKPSLDVLLALGLGSDNALYTHILNSMTNIRVNDIGAVVAYNESGSAVSLKMSSYDRIGRKKNQWIIYGIGTPAIQLSYTYNISDELTSSSFDEWNGSAWVAKSTRSREYDSKGRLVKTKEDGKLLASYDRSEKGRISARHYYDKDTQVYTRSVTRDIHGRPLSIGYTKNGQTLYSQSLNYTTPAAAKLAETQQQWNNVPSLGNVLHSNTYDYDDLGRLVSANGSLSGSYTYDEVGRLTSKNEDDDLLLVYGSSSYKPSQISINSASPATWHNYDASGNLWLDSKAKVAYLNNARGLPESVRRYSELPAGITLSAVDNGTVFDEEFANISMAYDEGGQRIWQRFVGRDRSNRVEATIPGVGVYTKETLQSAFELSRLDLVGGGFRQGTAGEALFPVQDVQGNVRGYANKNGLVSAYGYYPFGTIQELTESSSADRKRWQGKEYDGEHGKYYFGARFFDPYFGLWTSPDPAGQFANPYTYGGDPLNYVDPDGEFVHIIVGAIVGGVIGTVSGIAQCSGPGEQSCGKSIGVGNVGGSMVGAAAAATGGAVGAAAGGGIFGGIAGGAAGGAVSGAGNYLNNFAATGQGTEGTDLGDAIWKGAVAGAVGGGVGSIAGNYMAQGWAGMTGGFAGGATGSALNGGNRWEILQGGLMGAGVSLGSALLSASFGTLSYDESVGNTNSDDSYKRESGTGEDLVATEVQKRSFENFQEVDEAHLNEDEVMAVFNKRTGNYVSKTLSLASNSSTNPGAAATTELNIWGRLYLTFNDGIIIHSHRFSSVPSNSDAKVSLNDARNQHFIYLRPNAGFYKHNGKLTNLMRY